MLFGDGDFARDDAPEPSLLPHLARMVHPGSDVRLLLMLAEAHGLHGVAAPPWYALWNAVVAALTDDPEMRAFLVDDGIDVDELVGRLDGFDNVESFAGRAYLLPGMPPEQRAAVANGLAAELPDLGAPPWFVALVVSRIAPFRTPETPWPAFELPGAPWVELIERLIVAGPATGPHGDVLRAHPFADALLSVGGRHETSAEALHRVMGRWGPHMASANGGDDDGRGDAGDGPRALQAGVFAAGREVRRAFVAGAAHTVDISIGRQGPIRATSGFVEPELPPDVERVPLLIRFGYGDEVQEKTIQLPRDQAKESTAATFEFTVPPGDQRLEALVVVYFEGAVVQGALLTGDAVADHAAEEAHGGAIGLTVHAWIRDLDRPVASSGGSSVVVSGNQVLAATPTAAINIDPGVLRDKTAELAARIQSGADLITSDDDELERLLRDLARHGQGLRKALKERLPNDMWAADHLQIVVTDPTAFLPLELVYDGPPATEHSKLCPTWREALAAGRCEGCDGGGPDADAAVADPRICPLRFWALSKVIERHAGLTGAAAGDFGVRVERTDNRARLRPLDSAVVGRSELVEQDDFDRTVKAVRAAFGNTRRAANWSAWVKEVGTRSPAVLVAMPHHTEDSSADPPLDSLELGTKLLNAGSIQPAHVRTSGAPGPLLVLLGCNTALDSTPLDSFSGEFRLEGAAVVVGTLGEVIASDAARAVEALVAELARALQPGGAGTVGEALLAVRRSLLAKGLVLGLMVVGHGDADWLLPEVV